MGFLTILKPILLLLPILTNINLSWVHNSEGDLIQISREVKLESQGGNNKTVLKKKEH